MHLKVELNITDKADLLQLEKIEKCIFKNFQA